MPIDAALAFRLEQIDALNSADYIFTLQQLESTTQATVQALEGATALLMGAAYPINRLAMAEFGPPQDAVLQRFETLCQQVGVKPYVSYCPLGESGWLELLAKRGYRVQAVMNVYVQRLEGGTPQAWPSELQVVSNPSFEQWYEASHAAWQLQGLPEQKRFAEVAWRRPQALNLVGYWQGQPAAVAAMRGRNDIAMLNGTATAPPFRGRGIQKALLQQRLHLARQQGYALATVMALPGSVSGRNLERQGFRLAYQRLSFGLG